MFRSLTAATLVAAMVQFAPVSALAAEPPAFELTIKDHKFTPSVVFVPSGQKVILRVRNLDPTPEEFESHDLHREKLIAPGASADIYIGPLPPGSYGFFGEFHARTARGKVFAK